MRNQEKKRKWLKQSSQSVLTSDVPQPVSGRDESSEKVLLSQDEVRMVSYIRRDAVRVVIALMLVAGFYVATNVALHRSQFIGSLGARMAVAAGLKSK